MICVEGNRFLLTGFQAESTPAQSPSLPQDPELPLLPERLQARTMLRSSPYFICPSASHANRSPSSLACAFVSFRVPIFSQKLSPSASGVCCSQSPCSGPGPVCYALCPQGWCPGWPMSQCGTLTSAVVTQIISLARHKLNHINGLTETRQVKEEKRKQTNKTLNNQ